MFRVCVFLVGNIYNACIIISSVSFFFKSLFAMTQFNQHGPACMSRAKHLLSNNNIN